MIHGTVRFTLFGAPARAELTDAGWRLREPAGAIPDEALDALASAADFGAADGDPSAAAVMKLAAMLEGAYELADLPGPGPGALY